MKNIEIWLPIPEWENVYEVSNLGRIKRIKKNRCRLGILKTHTRACDGYCTVHLRDTGISGNFLVHRLVAFAFLGEPPEGKDAVNHKNGIRNDNRTDNLEWCSNSENHLHAYSVLNRSKVCSKGIKNGRAKLSDEQIKNIRDRYDCGNISQQKLADEFNVSQPMIGLIVRRENWSHL